MPSSFRRYAAPEFEHDAQNEVSLPLRIIEVADCAGIVSTHNAHQRADHRERGDEALRGTSITHSCCQVSGTSHQLHVHVLGQLPEGGETRCSCERITRQGAGVEHGAERRQMLHDVGTSTD